MAERLLLFDDGKGELSPLNDLRASYDIRIGALSNAERLGASFEARIAGLWVPRALTDLAKQTHDLPINGISGDGPLLAVNGRCPLPLREILGLASGQMLVERQSGDVIAARADTAGVRSSLESGEWELEAVDFGEIVLLGRPWHARSARDAALEVDLEMLVHAPSQELPGGVMHIGDQPAVIDPNAVVYPGVTLVCEDGPVVISEHATIRPGATLIGPCFVGMASMVLEHAIIREHTAIGPVCKVAGEVAGCVFQGFANKAHDGFLGDSWIGEWVNLGAGTTNSNLLNTYSEVVCDGASGRERTGETFLGAIIGDHVKTAIGTRIMTGSILHTGSMFAQTAPVSGTVPAFTWATDKGQQSYRRSKFLEVVRVAMGRRDVEPSEAYVARLADLHPGAAES